MLSRARIGIPLVLLALASWAPGARGDFGFAESLLTDRDNEGAISEYKRFIFLNPESESLSAAYHRIAIAHRNLRNWDECIVALNRSIRRETDDSLRTEREIMIAVVTAAMGDFDLAEFRLIRIEAYSPYPSLRKRAAFYRGVFCVYQSRWDEARHAFQVAFADSSIMAGYSHIGGDIDSLTLAAGLHPRKNPELAKWLSTFIPGSGQFYACDWKNGFNALAINSATGYFLIENLVEGNWADAALTYLFLFGRYYFGNRYHAAESAREYNRRLDIESRDRILSLFDEAAD